MTAVTYNFTLEQGVPLSKTVLLKNSDNSIKDLTGFTALMHLRQYPSSEVVLLELSSANSKININTATGAVTLATADGAATKAPRRIPVGFQSFAIGAAIAAQANTLSKVFQQPLAVNAGNYLHVFLKIPIGTATASQIIRGTVTIDATWE